MTEVVLSVVLFVVASALLWLANRLACPKRLHTELDRRVERGPVFFTAVLVYWGLTALLARPLSVFAISLLGIALLFAGNALKARLLGEVLLFSDVFLAGHALRFPRLYFGYVPKWVWAVLAILLIVIISKIAQEPASAEARVLGAVLFLSGAVAAWFGLRRLVRSAQSYLQRHRPTFRAQSDAARFTPMGAALVHVVSHLSGAENVRRRFEVQQTTQLAIEKREGDESPAASKQAAPRHFVLIQAESYCPAGELLARDSTTPVIDALRADGCGGRLLLDWRGAYTMRTEFSVLTGLECTALESYAFDPYQLARRIPMDSLVRDFKAKGYDTVAWHPNDGRFFDRFAVMPHLGFSSLMDIAAFSDLPRVGHYVGDEALLEKAAEFLAGCTRPTFLFIVTIEAHGPWSGKAEAQLREYETHLANLDAGIKRLTTGLAQSNPGSMVALYGDHLPSLAAFRSQASATAWFAHVCGEHSVARYCEHKDLPAQALRDELLAIHRRYEGEVS